jgi:glycosyltransferase involved in cell wall biosynthesis
VTRVLLSVAELAAGGAERMVVELAAGLRVRGDEIAVAADTGPFDRLLRDSGIERHVLPGRGRSPITAARAIRRLRVAMRAFRPDLVHSHNVKATGIAAVARMKPPRRARVPLLTTFHGVRREEYRRAAAVLRRADFVVCVSQDLVDGLAGSGLSRERMKVIRNAVPPAEPLTPSARESIDRELRLDGRPVVSMVGRLVPQKAPQRFVEAAARIAADNPDCAFLVVGDGPLRTTLDQLSRRLGVWGQFRFTGVREDARQLIARSDVLAFSSDWEGMSVVALEALAAGVPVVSTDVEGARELLADGPGVVVPRAAEPLADAIAELLRTPSRRAEMGRIGRARIAAEYSVAGMVTAYRELYAELAA